MKYYMPCPTLESLDTLSDSKPNINKIEYGLFYDHDKNVLIRPVVSTASREVKGLMIITGFVDWFYHNVVLDIMLNHSKYGMFNSPILYDYVTSYSNGTYNIKLIFEDVNWNIAWIIEVNINRYLDISLTISNSIGFGDELYTAKTTKFESTYDMARLINLSDTIFNTDEDHDKFLDDLKSTLNRVK